jgi:D-cysteine desulfhydrase
VSGARSGAGSVRAGAPSATSEASPRPGQSPATGSQGGLAALPRVSLVLAPTPLHPAPQLSRELGVRILFKRDDLSGRGLGGNKLRGLEFIVADAQAQGCDCLVTGGGPQSNWTLLAALACHRFEIEPHVVSYGEPPADEGNLRLHRWLGTDVRFTGEPERASVDTGISTLAAELGAAGRRPYVVPRGGATPLGALGYVQASVELAAQLAGLGEEPAGLWTAAGSCGTQAGLLAGAALTGAPYRVTGVTVSRPVTEAAERVRSLAAGAAALAGITTSLPEPTVLGGWIGPGYGAQSGPGRAAARLVARTEGVFLDPVFGAKAMAALIAACQSGLLTGSQVFLVSGGAPALFTTGKAAL